MPASVVAEDRHARLGLHARGDCYVSMAHGEGWDVPAFDAVAYGNPVVVTGWGGPRAFLDDDAFLVSADLVPVRHFEPQSYAPEQNWVAPRVDHAVELMREVARDITAARRRVARPEARAPSCREAGREAPPARPS